MTNALHFGTERRALKAMGVTLSYRQSTGTYGVYLTSCRKATELSNLTLSEAANLGREMTREPRSKD